jgi:hypothetical protein
MENDAENSFHSISESCLYEAQPLIITCTWQWLPAVTILLRMGSKDGVVQGGADKQLRLSVSYLYRSLFNQSRFA